MRAGRVGVAPIPWENLDPTSRFPLNARHTMLNSTLVHQANPGRRLRGSAALAWLAAITILCGCRTLPPMPAMDLSGPGWKVSEGSALWRSGRDAPEIAGEILLAIHPDGRGFVQFTKSPLPFVVAQLDGQRWRVEFIPENRSFAGRDYDRRIDTEQPLSHRRW